MKVVLFCGGLGTRLREHSETIPKPLVEIGGRPILWHLMKYYASFGHKDFILCLGYRGDLIRQYFLDYNPYIATNFVMKNGGAVLDPAKSDIDDWTIRFVDTGLHSNLGERLVAVKEYLDGEDHFLANYSDQLSNLPLEHYVEKAISKNAVASFLSVKSQQSFHYVETGDDGYVVGLRTSDETDQWINGGYFVFRKEIFDFIQTGEELVEQPFSRLAKKGMLWTHRYSGFWRSMDTLKDKIFFDRINGVGEKPWVADLQENGDRDSRGDD